MNPLRGFGSVDTFVHFIEPAHITNTHFAEGDVKLPPAEDEARRLSPCRFVVEEQDAVDKEFSIKAASVETMRRSHAVLSEFNDLTTVMNIHRSRLSLYSAGLMVRRYPKLEGFQHSFWSVWCCDPSTPAAGLPSLRYLGCPHLQPYPTTTITSARALEGPTTPLWALNCLPY